MDRKILWHEKPEEHNYPAAFSYLNLLFKRKKANIFVDALQDAKVVHFKAKDIFRASGLSLLGVSNSHVEENNRKIKMGRKLSPILIVRDPQHGKIVIADGYHRLCSVYHFHEDALIPCKIV